MSAGDPGLYISGGERHGAGCAAGPRKKERRTMDLGLQGKRAFVSGSTSGIGEAIARNLAAEGAAVVINGRDEKEAARIAGAIEGQKGQVSLAVGDLRTEEGAAAVAAKALAGGPVDILVNNAGSYAYRPFFEVSAASFLETYDGNVGVAVRMIRAFAPAMRERGWGRVIQVGSAVGVQPPPEHPDYSAAKAALTNLTVSLAKALSGSGVTVNTVSPGMVATAKVTSMLTQMGGYRGWGSAWADVEKAILREVLPNGVGRLGRVEDVAHLVAFLASPLSGYIHGADLRIDGGSTVTTH
jgi:NAD(P)-dependent dehydrogenase (short-subunit alcohol dehydrogenase family)